MAANSTVVLATKTIRAQEVKTRRTGSKLPVSYQQNIMFIAWCYDLSRGPQVQEFDKVQSFSNAVHPLWRSSDHKVARIFRAKDDDRDPRSPLIVP